jgi:2-amino-4-hydroxy-6-hydroxymethyldihydropteridine diphosphokinase
LYAVKRAYIALGANLPSRAGEPSATLRAALEEVAKFATVVRVSLFYRTEPVGITDQPEFTNAVAAIDVTKRCTPHKLLENLLRVERSFGRDRASETPNGPRTLDLDLLLFSDYVQVSSKLTIPHPRMHERAFVLVPLAEIAPELKLPTTGRAITEILAEQSPNHDAVLAI